MSQQINLYRHARRRRPPVHAGQIAAAAVLVLVVLTGLSVHGWWRATALEREASAAEADRDALEQRVSRLSTQLQEARGDADSGGDGRQQRLRAELDAKRGLLAYLEDGPLAERTGFSGHLEGLARRVVDDLWLSLIRLSEGGRRLHLRGHALAPTRVPELIAALGEESPFAGHTFRQLHIRRPEDHPGRIDFELATVPGDPDDERGEQR